MVSGLARCSFALRPARSLTPFGGACYTKGFGHFIASIPASATTGWSVSCRVGFLLSHWSSAPFHGAPKQALKDHLDIKGHDELIIFLVLFIQRKEILTEAAIREMHKILLKEPYETDAIT